MKKIEILNSLKDMIMKEDVKSFEKVISQKGYIDFITKPYLVKGRTIQNIRFDYSDLKEICGNDTREEMLIKLIDINNHKFEIQQGKSIWDEKILEVYKIEEEIDTNVIAFLIKLKNKYTCPSERIYFNIESVLEKQLLHYSVSHGKKVLEMLIKLKEEGYKFYIDYQCITSCESLKKLLEANTLKPEFILEILKANDEIFELLKDSVGYTNHSHLTKLLFMAYVLNDVDVVEAIKKSGIKNYYRDFNGKYDSLFIFKEDFCYPSKLTNKLMNKAFLQKFGYEFEGDIVENDTYFYTDSFIEFWSNQVLKDYPKIKQMIEKDALNKDDYNTLCSVIFQYHLNRNLEEIININKVEKIKDIPACGEISIMGHNKKFTNENFNMG